MAYTLTKHFAIVCEGRADQKFLTKLLNQRAIETFDIPAHEALGAKEKKEWYGWQGFGRLITALSGDPSGYANLRGVAVIADSGDSQDERFTDICSKLSEHGPYTDNPFVPLTSPYRTTKQANGHPAISIMMLPAGGPGALETLCVESIFIRVPWLRDCVERYLSCGDISALTWGREKQDKARMQCVIAALNKEDPNKGLAYLLSVDPPLVDLESEIFTPIVGELQRFCNEVAAL